jgi:lipid-binding SYLF domain-containing protein
MHRPRQLGSYTAVYSAGAQSKKPQRASDTWYFDLRISEPEQTGEDLYTRDALGYGHLVRRLDPSWGEDAVRAHTATRHFNNCVPQHTDFNQNGERWQGIENYLPGQAARASENVGLPQLNCILATSSTAVVTEISGVILQRLIRFIVATRSPPIRCNIHSRKGSIMKPISTVFVALLATLALSSTAWSQNTATKTTDTTSSAGKQEKMASKHVAAAVEVARKLESDDRMRSWLNNAKGVFIVPSYGRVALGVGGAGGAGVLLVRRANSSWSDPVFYNTGGLSVGLQAGVQGGAFALILNNDKAVQEFLKKNNFSLNAKADLTVLNWSKMAQATGGTGDVIAWSSTKGLFGDALTIELNDVRFNQQLTNAYYQRTLSASDVVEGKSTNPQAAALVNVIASAAGSAR